MRAIHLLEQIKDYAEKYRIEAIKISRNKEMEVIDETLVNFINFIGAKHGIDYGMRKEDFEEIF